MVETVPVAVAGVAGRMGQRLAAAVLAEPATHLVGALVREGHPWAGRPLGDVLPGVRGAADLDIETDPLPVFARARAVLDFTRPETTVALARLAAQARLVHVVGTTGFAETDLAALAAAARHAVVVRAGNMSLGVTLLTALTRQVAAALDAEYDIEIVETHHRHKVDAPSGTALMLGEAAAAGRGGRLADLAERGRDGVTGPRERGRIGMAALRGGDVVGEHDVIFAGPGERIVLRHIATDRGIFARGAVKAALWGQGRPPGEYDMTDVLGIA